MPDHATENSKMLLRIAALALSLCAIAPPVSAADYPDHAIKMVVPFAAGGGTDVLARMIAQNLNSKWGQPVVVENQPGASGGIGTRAVMKAAPDGYTLLMASTGALMAVSSGVDGCGPFDVNKVLTPIVIGAAPPYLLVASPTLPVKTTAELIRYAKEKPEGLTFGSSGVGAASHLSGLLFASETGIKLVHIPYKGTGPAVTDLLGGRIDVMFAPALTVTPHIAAGTLRVIGTTGSARSALFPDFATVAETGMPGYSSLGWFGLFAPAGTPRDIVAKVSADTKTVLTLAEARRRLAEQGAEPQPSAPDDFAAFVNADIAKWLELAHKAGIKLTP